MSKPAHLRYPHLIASVRPPYRHRAIFGWPASFTEQWMDELSKQFEGLQYDADACTLWATSTAKDDSRLVANLLSTPTLSIHAVA